jgi:hypothetical protein
MKRLLLILCCALLGAPATLYATDERQVIGLVKTATGETAIVRDGQRLTVQPGTQLFEGDVLTTGASGTLAIILRDDTRMSLGASTETRLDQFAFAPAEKRLGMVVRVTRGIFSYVSGKIAKLAPGAVRLETPTATLGIRGTYLVARIEP